MVFLTHLKVLLYKNCLTLKRNYCFAITFILLPIITMGIFLYARVQLEVNTKPQASHYNMMFYSTTNLSQYTFNKSSSSVFMNSPNVSIGNFFDDCVKQNLYNISLVGEPTLVEPFETFFSKYYQHFIHNLGNANFNVSTYATTEDVFNIVSEQPTDSFCFGMNISTFDTTNDIYDIQLMFPQLNLPSTNNPPYDYSINTPDFSTFTDYETSGFLELYPIITQIILEQRKVVPPVELQVAYVPMMTQGYIAMNDSVVQILQLIFPAFFMFTYLIPLYYMVSKLAEEKQSKSKEGMKMMGLQEIVYFLSWFLLFLAVMVVMGLVIICMIGPGLFYQSNKMLILFMCILYGMSLFAESLLICALLPNARSSATLSTLFHVITYFLVYTVQNPYSSFVAKFFLSLFPNIAMSLSIYTLFHFEQQGSGLTFANSGEVYANYSFTEGILMLLLDFLLYSGAGYYWDQILCDYGVHKPWYFLCTKKYWCGSKKPIDWSNRNSLKKNEKEAFLSIQDEGDDEQDERNQLNFEPVAETIKRQEITDECLKIRGLRKEFGGKVAVNNVSLTMYSGQIFALLGHNGAGKTTTISMLTGLIEQTKGKASVFGINVFEEQDELRKHMGVCPQHDVLFDFLTPKEHLRLFAAFKGTDSNQIENQVIQMINDLDLVAVQNQMVNTLSGGQKRKLSVGIAMIGNSKLIILDEPTSGMDTSSRRRLWEMLKQQKMGRIIILTTHYMDEADILGDRIAIMAAGTVKCCGSSLFLKNRFGIGYNLVIAKKDRNDAPQIDKFVSTMINKAIKLQEVSSEMTFQLPTDSHAQFKEFFAQLDQNIDKLGISSYGVGITTLEEVFLKIGKSDHEEDTDFVLKGSQMSSNSEVKSEALSIAGSPHVSSDLNGNAINPSHASKNVLNNEIENYSVAEAAEEGFRNLFLLQLGALLKKKLTLQIRDLRSLIIEIFFPIILIVCGLALTTLVVHPGSHERYMSPTVFPQNNLLYNLNGQLGGQPSTTVNTYFTNSSEWNILQPLLISNQPNDTNFYELMQEMDIAVFNTQDEVGGYFANYYFYDTVGSYNGAIAYVVFVNATSQDASGAFGAYLHELYLQQMTGNPNLQLNINSYPFPLSLKEQGFVTAIGGTFASILFAMSYMMISKSLVENIIRERERNVKHQILVSGAGLPAYWLSHYIGDCIFESLPSIAAIVAYKSFHIDVFFPSSNFLLQLPEAWVFFVVYIFINPIFVYALSALFVSEATASIMIRIIYIILGVVLPVATTALLFIPGTYKVGQVIRWFFFLFPIFSLDYGILVIADQSVLSIVDSSIKGADPLSQQLAGPALYFLIIDFFFYWAILALVEYGHLGRCMKRCRKSRDEQHLRKISVDRTIDEDVLAEDSRVKDTTPDSTALTVRLCDFRKTYEDLVAVDQLTFGLEYGECFALLGTTGAGKTTTFKCLTGHEKPTCGSVHINGKDITTSKGFEEARRQIGYCPQFDAIFEGMTVLEHLRFYAKIKGILTIYREEIVRRQIKEMDLEEYVNVRAEKLSGGNKRKLSVAMAMIGNPPIVFLDEPSTGVDPKAKRFMWSIVSKISTQRKKSSVIITTHSMEEAEALCTKMSIMVGGRFKCFGSSQHIKAKFGTGYEVEFKIRTQREEELLAIKEQHNITKPRLNKEEAYEFIKNMDASELISEITNEGIGYIFYEQFKNGSTIYTDELIKWVFAEQKGADVITQLEMIFSSLQIIEHHNNSFKLKVSRDHHSIGYLFGFMEDIKGEFDVSEYSVCQTSLEQIFNNFAKEGELGTKHRNSIRQSSKMPRKSVQEEAKTNGN